ncbi:TPA: hypothetical protein ACT9L0_000776, partial [Legionella pneumophila]
MAIIFKLFLTLNSLCLVFAIFLVNNKVDVIEKLFPSIKLPHIFAYTSYFVISIFFTWVSIYIAKSLGDDQISSGSITEVEPANDTYLPVYLGYFFVALSINDFQIFFFIFTIIFL